MSQIQKSNQTSSQISQWFLVGFVLFLSQGAQGLLGACIFHHSEANRAKERFSQIKILRVNGLKESDLSVRKILSWICDFYEAKKELHSKDLKSFETEFLKQLKMVSILSLEVNFINLYFSHKLEYIIDLTPNEKLIELEINFPEYSKHGANTKKLLIFQKIGVKNHWDLYFDASIIPS